MALEIKSCSEESCDATYIRYKELTGAYSNSNDTGWGAPNPETTDITEAVIEVTMPDSTTYQPTGDPIEISVTGTFPTDNNSSYYDITNSQLGYAGTAIPDGAYLINPRYSDGSTTYREDDSETNWILFDQKMQCDIQRLNSMIEWRNGVCCNTKLLDSYLLVKAKSMSMWDSWWCNKPLQALDRMIEAKKILNKLLNC